MASAQHDCPTLQRTYAHLTQGTHPSKKTKHVKDLRRYLQVATLNERGLLTVRKSDPFCPQRELIVVPCDMLPGLITALHICFQHPTKHQLSSLFQRYFCGLCIDTVISEVTNNCHQCNSLKKLPREVFEQSSSKSPECPGQQFAADIIRRCKQKIFVTRDIFSSFSTATLIPDETANTLRDYLIINTAPIQNNYNNSTIRIDNAPGFTALKDDKILQSRGIYLDFGDIKNINKNPVAEKGIQEIEAELLRRDPSGNPVTPVELSVVIESLNSRLRNRGLSAKEILLQTDQNTGEKFTFNDKELSFQQHNIRLRNHLPSSLSKVEVGIEQKRQQSRLVTWYI